MSAALVEHRVRAALDRYGVQLAGLAIAVGLALTVVALTRQSWVMSDGAEYAAAAERLRNGEPLYVPVDVGERSYRYSPWFAYAWMVVDPPGVVWMGAMSICAVLAVLPALRSRSLLGIALGALVFPYLLISAMGGHVQPALIAMLVHAAGRGWAPIAIALAASLKLAPIVYVVVFIGQRRWGAAALTVGLSMALLAPYLLFDLTHFPTSTEGSWALFEWSPVLWAIVCLGLLLFVIRQPSWKTASVLVTVGIPKFVYYDVGYLLVGHRRHLEGTGKRNRQSSRTIHIAQK